MEIAAIFTFFVAVVVGLPLLSAGFSYRSWAWQAAEFFGAASLCAAVLVWVSVVFFDVVSAPTDWLTLTPLRATLWVLVTFIAFIVLRYARTNFNNDADNARFLRWLSLTIFSVTLSIVSNNLALFWFAWVSISLSMHKLLVFYSERYRAVLAAHKKFIFARLAELCLGIAFLLLYNHHNSYLISDILNHYPASTLSFHEQLAAILLAIVALIKCAQLPLHGWLIQVVESPTPVSALLHAGVINLGGFLMLLFAPLISQAVYAHWVLLIVSGFTAAFAALVMMTRISIKVRLAWSTTAQMGLMLVECALGLYELALLHLLAHSCYKAHAFLNAGNAVSDAIQNQYTGKIQPSLSAWLVALTVSLCVVAAAIFASANTLVFSPWVLMAIALTILLATRLSQSISYAFVGGVVDVVIFTAMYVLFKFGISQLITPVAHSYCVYADLFISALFLSVFIVYLFLEYKPLNQLSRRLFIALNAGFYLDEWSTRLTLMLWPIHIPKNEQTKFVSN